MMTPTDPSGQAELIQRLRSAYELHGRPHQEGGCEGRCATCQLLSEAADALSAPCGACDVKPCEICEWPQPMQNEDVICPCCGFQPGCDDPKTYVWLGQWWSKSHAPRLVRTLTLRAETTEAALAALRAELAEKEYRLMWAEIDVKHQRERAEAAERMRDVNQRAAIIHETAWQRERDEGRRKDEEIARLRSVRAERHE